MLKKGCQEPPEWLFDNELGNLVDENKSRKWVVYKSLDKANRRKIWIHDLRHTYATLRISSGQNIADVSRQLGHHFRNNTAATYANWMPVSGKAEIDRLDLVSAPNCTQ